MSSSEFSVERIEDPELALRAVERQLGRSLVDRRLLNVDDLERYALDAHRAGLPLTRVLIESGRVDAGDVLDVVAERIGLARCVIDDDFLPDPTVLALLDAGSAHRLQALPYGKDAAGRVLIAVADPLNEAKRGDLRRAVGSEVRLALADAGKLAAAVDRAYGPLRSLESVRKVAPGAPADDDKVHVNRLLEILIDMKGSDLHLTAGTVPQVRVDGELIGLDEFGVLKPAPLRSMLYEILTNRQKQQLEERRELDCSHPLPGKGRFRVNMFFQRGSIGAVMRAIPNEIVPLSQLGMPEVVADLAQLQRGLVLVTGPTGSGKSTTLASILDLVNSTRAGHIMTVEDPIEFMHRHKRSIVNQREVGADTLSFSAALKHALRQDPDVILVGEMRDLETIATAITAAETGHLVFATLHTQNAPKSVERIIDVFPAHQQQQIRVQLASSLQAIIAQQLLPRRSGSGRVAAVELMIVTAAIRNLIRESKLHQITTAMQAGGKYGMQTMDQALAALVKDGTIDYPVAVERAHDIGALRSLVDERFRT